MNIIGLNYGHDSGASIIVDDKLICCINEERLTRKKLFVGYPDNSIKTVLETAGLKASDIDLVSIEGKYFSPEIDGNINNDSSLKKIILRGIGLEKYLLGSKYGIWFLAALFQPITILRKKAVKKKLRMMGISAKTIFVDHHQCHAATAYYAQNKKNGIAITLDASGEGWCSKIFSCDGDSMQLLQSIPCYHSPAYFYAHVTKLLGFIPLRHEGKITGLAAYGNPKYVSAILNNLIYFDSVKNSFVNKAGYGQKLYDCLKEKLRDYSREDISAGLQFHTEKIVCSYILNSIKRYASDSPTDIFLSGGLFANVKLNQAISNLNLVRSLFVFPNMGDGGIGCGAALLANSIHVNIDNYYLGNGIKDIDNIDKLVKENGLRRINSENLAYDVAKMISDGYVVAICNGRMEYGPRALGNRSILYSATDVNANAWLNEKLGRSEFMPFAPVVRDVDAEMYFELNGKSTEEYQHMTITCPVKKKCIDEAPAIVHVDLTARPQILNFKTNNFYYQILTEYKKISGRSILVNTSFNMHEEPIVCSAYDAIHSFIKSNIHALVIENRLIKFN